MKKSLIALAVMGASTVAFAASNVTLYGVIEEGVLVQKAKHQDTTVSLKSGFDQGSRWGIRGVEELGNGYAVGFILEQGFNADDGSEAMSGKQFSRESQLYVQGGFGKLGFGRFGTLSSGAGSYQIVTGWAIGTGFGLSSWTSKIGTSFSRVDNGVAYQTPSFNGLQLSAMYSNGTKTDDEKWSKNNHYYGIGAKYEANAIKSSLIFEAVDNKDTAGTEKKKTQYAINFGFEYNLGTVTPMFAYQWAHQDEGKKTNMFGLSAKVAVGGGDALVGARYLFGDDAPTATDDKVRSWNIGAAYIYPLSKRTALKAYAGYADSSKGWKDTEEVVYNGYQLFLGMRHSF
ncbi:porin [Turicimonas muris]|uniref:porin n=1 Tax=Turicimonas muris TaxID=1796652 RepID=UPI002676CB79|nr:porin [Turicimonas muris]